MALFIRQDEERSELQKKLVAELQEKAKNRSKDDKLPDGVEDSQYINGTKKTTSFVWAWVLIIIIIIVLIFFMISNKVAR